MLVIALLQGALHQSQRAVAACSIWQAAHCLDSGLMRQLLYGYLKPSVHTPIMQVDMLVCLRRVSACSFMGCRHCGRFRQCCGGRACAACMGALLQPASVQGARFLRSARGMPSPAGLSCSPHRLSHSAAHNPAQPCRLCSKAAYFILQIVACCVSCWFLAGVDHAGRRMRCTLQSMRQQRRAWARRRRRPALQALLQLGRLPRSSATPA